MIRLMLKKVLSLFMVLAFLVSAACMPCFAVKGKNKSHEDSYRRTFYSYEAETDDHFNGKLIFKKRELKRVFVGIYNDIIGSLGLCSKTKNINLDFYIKDLFVVKFFLESQKSHEFYSDDDLVYFTEFIKDLAADNNINNKGLTFEKQ